MHFENILWDQAYSPGKGYFLPSISISRDKTRVEKELSHFYLFLLKNSVEVVLSDCSQDYTHDQLRSDQQWPIRKKIALINNNLY